MAASWGILGASWAVLGRHGSILGAHGSILVVLTSTRPAERVQLAPKREPKWDPKCDPKRTKINDKNEAKKRYSSRSSSSGLGAILGRSWAPPISKIVLPPRAGIVFLKINVFEKVRCQEATWAELGLLRRPKGIQNGAQEETKTEQKKRRKLK